MTEEFRSALPRARLLVAVLLALLATETTRVLVLLRSATAWAALEPGAFRYHGDHWYGHVMLGVSTLAKLAYVWWFWRAYGNVHYFAGFRKHSKLEFLVSFALPIVNLFVPYLMLKEAWQQSGRRRERDPHLPTIVSIAWAFHAFDTTKIALYLVGIVPLNALTIHLATLAKPVMVVVGIAAVVKLTLRQERHERSQRGLLRREIAPTQTTSAPNRPVQVTYRTSADAAVDVSVGTRTRAAGLALDAALFAGLLGGSVVMASSSGVAPLGALALPAGGAGTVVMIGAWLAARRLRAQTLRVSQRAWTIGTTSIDGDLIKRLRVRRDVIDPVGLLSGYSIWARRKRGPDLRLFSGLSKTEAANVWAELRPLLR